MKTRSLLLFSSRLISILTCILAISTSYAASPDCIAEKSCVPVTVDNQSGTTLYVEIAGSQTKSYFNFATGDYDYNKPFSSDNLKKISSATVFPFNLPGDGITGGARMYFATSEMNGVPNLATSPIIFDKIELGWSKSTAVWNTTSVDYFAIPINMTQQNGTQTTTVGFKDGTTRQAVMDQLQTEMLKEKDLYDAKFFMTAPVHTVNAGQLLRVFSPLHFYTTLSDHWHDSIVNGLNALDAGAFTSFVYNGHHYDNFTKIPGSDTSIYINENGKRVLISGITTANAASGQIKPIGDQFAGMLSAAINRGVLSSPEHWGENDGANHGYPQYYYQGQVGSYVYNTYAAVLLKFAIDSKLYATSYDDFWHMDSSLNVGPANNNPVTIKILPFN